jgi:hypothetical protein
MGKELGRGAGGPCMYNSTCNPTCPSAQKEASVRVAKPFCCCSTMTIKWEYAVGTWWQGTLHIMSYWYGAKAGAQAEYEQLGQSMLPLAIRGKAFIIRRAVQVLPDGGRQGPMLGPFDLLDM